MIAFSERELITRIIKCEAGGERDNGMKAVASVLMNRVNSSEGEYARISKGGSIRNIIFRMGQFDFATDNLYGKYNPQNIYNMQPEQVHYQIADWAMAEVLTNQIYTPAYLKEQIGKLVPVQFLIGTEDLEDRTGILEEVGASYIVLRTIESGNLMYCDIYSIKFVVISRFLLKTDRDFIV